MKRKRAESNDVNKLPEYYENMASMIRCIDIVVCLFSRRGVIPKLSMIHTQVERMGAILTLESLRIVSILLPDMITVSSLLHDDPEIVIESSLVKTSNATDIKRRYNHVRKFLLNRVNEFLNEVNIDILNDHSIPTHALELLKTRDKLFLTECTKKITAESIKKPELSRSQLLLKNISIRTLDENWNLDSIVNVLNIANDEHQNEVVYKKEMSPKEPIYADFNLSELSPEIYDCFCKYFNCTSINLYRHQVLALEHLMNNENIVISTKTSSGKSMIYQIPVLECLLASDSCTIFVIFPTKALAQDQYRKFIDLISILGLDPKLCGIYDGDSSFSSRSEIERHARVILSNPDMLHYTILANWKRHKRFLMNLRYVIVDEVHYYRGLFGSHVGNAFLRLQRLCNHLSNTFYQIICCSATISNPLEHVQRLFPVSDFTLIPSSVDGSPSGTRNLVIWNCMDNVSPFTDAAHLLVTLVCCDIRTILFCKGRRTCELITQMCKNILKSKSSLNDDLSYELLSEKICSYRGGYSKQYRRSVEKKFFNGELLAVVSTDALELGIDIGCLDATIQLGFPGSVASFWQQVGRAGRTPNSSSVSILVLFKSPLDQYLGQNPDFLFEMPIEKAVANPFNSYILDDHALCAIQELALDTSQDDEYVKFYTKSVSRLEKLAWIRKVGDKVNIMNSGDWKNGGKSPHKRIDLRTSKWKTFNVVYNNTILDSMEEFRAYFEGFPGSVIVIQSKEYMVDNLDMCTLTIDVKPCVVEYYTKCRDITEVSVTQRVQRRDLCLGVDDGFSYVDFTRVKITTSVYGYRKIHKKEKTVLEVIDLSIPSLVFETEAIVIPVPESIVELVKIKEYEVKAGVHGISHLLQAITPLFVICDSLHDIGVECPSKYESFIRPNRIFLYDKCCGGSGIAKACINSGIMENMLRKALQTLSQCPCTSVNGCPCCIQSPGCPEYNEVSSKQCALLILTCIITGNVYFS